MNMGFRGDSVFCVCVCSLFFEKCLQNIQCQVPGYTKKTQGANKGFLDKAWCIECAVKNTPLSLRAHRTVIIDPLSCN